MARGMDMQAIMRQAQKMQNDMAKAQDELKATEVEGAAGGGVVKARVTCANEVVAIEIAPEVVDPEDVEMLQDLVLAAINDAMSKAAEITNERMGKVTGGLKMPF